MLGFGHFTDAESESYWKIHSFYGVTSTKIPDLSSKKTRLNAEKRKKLNAILLAKTGDRHKEKTKKLTFTVTKNHRKRVLEEYEILLQEK